MIGCNALFETGYITVDVGGVVRVTARATPEALVARMSQLDGRLCAAFNPMTGGYFEWHRANVFLG